MRKKCMPSLTNAASSKSTSSSSLKTIKSPHIRQARPFRAWACEWSRRQVLLSAASISSQTKTRPQAAAAVEHKASRNSPRWSGLRLALLSHLICSDKVTSRLLWTSCNQSRPSTRRQAQKWRRMTRVQTSHQSHLSLRAKISTTWQNQPSHRPVFRTWNFRLLATIKTETLQFRATKECVTILSSRPIPKNLLIIGTTRWHHRQIRTNSTLQPFRSRQGKHDFHFNYNCGSICSPIFQKLSDPSIISHRLAF